MTRLPDIKRLLSGKGYSTIALQAPEGLKRILPLLAEELSDAGYQVLISGDPCYGACDLDLSVRDKADVLLHIGHAPVDATPGVIYEIWPVDGDLSVLNEVIPILSGKKVGLVSTIQHIHLLNEAADILACAGFEVIIGQRSARTPHHGQVLGCSFESARNTCAEEIIFLGTGTFHPIGIRLATGARVIACDPVTGNIQEVNADRLLRVRFGLIQKALAAERYGILVSTKTGQCRNELAGYLCSLSSCAYKVFIREVTPDQLINLGFPCYVNTACPRIAFDDQVRYSMPVLTPPEFEILCGVREFSDYMVDEIK